jgi:hypothetical protein
MNLFKPKMIKGTDILAGVLIGGVCASLGPIGGVLAVGTTVIQFLYVRNRYKKDVQYAIDVNPIILKHYERVHKMLSK